MTNRAAILGIDNVRLELPIAGIGTRTLAAFVDYLLLLALWGLWWVGGIATMGFVEIAGAWVVSLLVLGSFLMQWSYFAVLEIVMKGQTPGKSVVGLRVVSYQGGRSSAGALLMRNLIRAVDFIFGLAVMAVDRRSRRLGDMAAGTLVIHDRPPGDDEKLRLHRVPPDWGPKEIVVVESFLRRAPRMRPERAQAMADQLLRWIGRRQEAFVDEAGEQEIIAQAAPAVDRVALLRRLLQASSVHPVAVSPMAASPTAPSVEAE